MAKNTKWVGAAVALSLVGGVVGFMALFRINPIELISGSQSVAAAAPQKMMTPTDPVGGFMAAVLGSTEDFWEQEFKQGRLPNYGRPAPSSYTPPTLVLFEGAVASGCGGVAAKKVGPVFCPPDRKLYIDQQFYEELAKDHHAPGDFAQAMVIAHEVGHHVQDLIGAHGGPAGENENRQSVRFELQADCFAGAWAHGAQIKGQLEPGDLQEAHQALINIGDDVLMRTGASAPDPATFSHGSGAQRLAWFQRGFAGDARNCDTFAPAYQTL